MILDLLLKYGVAYEHNVSFIDKVTKQKVEKVVRFNDPMVRTLILVRIRCRKRLVPVILSVLSGDNLQLTLLNLIPQSIMLRKTTSW